LALIACFGYILTGLVSINSLDYICIIIGIFFSLSGSNAF
jgi:hypothetical protein